MTQPEAEGSASPPSLPTSDRTPRRVFVLLAMLLLTATACDGPGPVTPTEIRWRWRHGKLMDIVATAKGVSVVVACPVEHGLDVVARFEILTRVVREFERRDPLQHRDTLAFLSWRHFQEAGAIKP